MTDGTAKTQLMLCSAATAGAQSSRDVPLYGTTHADSMNVPIPCTDFMEDDRINGDYEIETGNQIVSAFASKNLDSSEVQMVLVAGHGPFTWGKNGGRGGSERCGTAGGALQNGIPDGTDQSEGVAIETLSREKNITNASMAKMLITDKIELSSIKRRN